MTDEMLRKLVVFSALMLALENEGERIRDLITVPEIDAFLPLIEAADAESGRDTQITLMKTMLREHLTDILVTREEDTE